MDRIETEEFSVGKGTFFEAVTAVAGAVSFKRVPEGMFSAQMSLWTSDPDDALSLENRMDDTLRDAPLVAERRAVAFAGMPGEWSRVDDELKDYETDERRVWHRLRVLIAAPDGATWYHATAMSDGTDLSAVAAELDAMLGSLEVKKTGAEASEIRVRAGQEVDDLFAQMMARNAAARADTAGIGSAPAALPPAEDVEACFEGAVASVGLAHRREALRAIALPTLTLTEAGESDPDRLGESRVGGGPDLPEAIEWPRDGSGFHLNFLVQINLTDLPGGCADLPGEGLLLFFSGTDLSDGTVLFVSGGTPLVAHDLPPDAEDMAIRAMGMVRWDGEAGRFFADTAADGNLSVVADASGRLAFLRDGKATVVLASEYEIARSRQRLRFDRSLSVPFGMPGTVPAAYLDAGLADPSDFCLAVGAAFRLGDGPQHQMFGVTGVRDLAALQEAAADHARRSGWHDLIEPDDWFLLLRIASGGEAGFSFSDHGDLLFVANRRDTRAGRFERVHAFVESG